ncbi:transposase [Streptomyces phaeofaciens]
MGAGGPAAAARSRTARSPPRAVARSRPRVALGGVLYVLRTGVAWRDVPAETVRCSSGVTAWRRLRDWTEAGVWSRLHAALLSELRRVGLLELNGCSVDGSHVRPSKTSQCRCQAAAGAVQTRLRRWLNAHRNGSSPKVNRQDLHLDERADKAGFGEFRCLRSCFAQGQFPCAAEGLQHGNKARHVSRQAKPRRPVRLQQNLSNVLGRDGATVFLAPPIRAVHASPLGAPREHAAVEELTDIAGRRTPASTAPACDPYSLYDQGISSASWANADGILPENSALVDQICDW